MNEASAIETGALLWVDDDPDVLLAARLAVRPLGAPLLTAVHPREVLPILTTHTVDVVVLDLNFSHGASDGAEGLACLSAVLAHDADAAVVIASAWSDVSLAVQAIKRGAIDYVIKPWTEARLLETLDSARQLRRRRRAARSLAAAPAIGGTTCASASALLGASLAMRRVRDLLARAAPSDANVLLLGENGTGKELAATDLHRWSRRASGPLVSIDLGALPASVFDSEIFGHRRGAFTDARSDRIGRLQEAHGGTLFLDEIGNLPLALQPKLLTALEERRITPLGANAPVALDVRVVAATNLSREQLYDEALFRRDLLFRLNTIEVELPPLRTRRDDIVPLARHFLAHYARKYGKPDKPLDPRAAEALCDHGWPGNVRALRHCAERAVVLGQAESYETADFALTVPVAAEPLPNSAAEDRGAGADLNLARREREAVEQALRRHGWKVAAAARELGLSRAALYRRMERYGL